MISTTPLHGLLALADKRHLGRAAQASRMSPTELAQALQALEAEYGHALLRTSAPPAERGQRFEGFTPQGERVLAWARGFLAQSEALRSELQASRTEAALAPLLERRSVSPKRLRPPAPTAEHIDAILQAALRAPDHGGLHPWRVIEFREAQRAALADRFEAEKLRRDPLASASDRRRAREHATRPPALLAFVVVPRARSKVPAREQWLAAGAALGNLLNAAHQLGFGAIVLSGERCFDETLARQLGVQPGEELVGFISVGTIAEAPPQPRETLSQNVWSCWQGEAPWVASPGALPPPEAG